MYKYIVIIIFVSSFSLFLNFELSANQNIDSIFNKFVELAHKGNYSQSIALSSKVLEIDPSRFDVAVFIANVYAWQKEYDSSKHYINIAYSQNPYYDELYNVWLNVLLWNREFEQIHTTLDIAQKHNYANIENIILKKILAYMSVSEYEKAIEYADSANVQNLKNEQINSLYNELYLLIKYNKLSAFYNIELFDTIKPWHWAYVDYSFKINKNTLVVRANYASRFEMQDIQLETDYYHLLKKGKYIYANYGISLFQNVFPLHRIGAEFYFPIKNTEASLGYRNLMFEADNISIVTAHLSKYFNNTWFSIRPYWGIGKSQKSLSAVASCRLFSSKAINYWGLEFSYGNISNERFFMTDVSSASVDNFKIKLERNIFYGKEMS